MALSAGELIGSSSLMLDALGSVQTRLSDLFESVPDEVNDGYLHIMADRPVRGFALGAESGSFKIAPAVTPQAIDGRQVPHAFWNEEGGTTRLRILNSGSREIRVRVEFSPDPSGFGVPDAAQSIVHEYSVAGKELHELDLKSLEPEVGERQGHLLIETVTDLSDGRTVVPPLVASVDYDAGSLSTKSCVSTVQLAQAREFSILQVAHGDGLEVFQGLAVEVPPYGVLTGPVTGSEQELPVVGLQITVEARDSRGYPTAAASVTIPYGGRFVGLLDDPRLFGPGFEQSGGHLTIRSPLPVSVISFYGGPGFLASAPAVITPDTE